MAGHDSDRAWDEYEWERFLQQQDQKTEKYMELLEKYIDDPQRDEIVAREMGWCHQVEENAEEWNQHIETALTPTQVVAHYESELRKLGWTFGEITEDGSVTLVTGNTRQEKEASRHVLLLASQSAVENGYVEMLIRLTKRVNPEPEPGKAG